MSLTLWVKLQSSFHIQAQLSLRLQFLPTAAMLTVLAALKIRMLLLAVVSYCRALNHSLNEKMSCCPEQVQTLQ